MPEAHAAEIHPVQMTKILRDVFQDPQVAQKYAKHLDKKVQVGLFCITGIRDCSRSRECHGHSALEASFQQLSEKAISPHQATPGSVVYDLFTPIDFQIQPKEHKLFLLTLPLRHLKGITPS